MSFQLLLWNLNRILGRQLCLECNFKKHLFSPVRLRHSAVNSGTLRPLKVTSVHRKTQHGPAKVNTINTSALHEMNEEDDPLDDFADSITKYSTQVNARLAEEQHMRQLFKEMKSIRAKTIGNKFFKKPPSPRLLTWAAEEQIRYLHHIDPDEWTIERLLELFPISKSSMKNILKSKYRLHRDKDVLKYDQVVLETWASLKASFDDDDMTTTNEVCQTFKNSVGEITIRNAAGIKSLPFPRRNTDRFNPKGKFSAIVQDCYEDKKKAMMKSAEELRNKSEEISALLTQVSQIFHVKTQGQRVRSRFLKESDLGQVDHDASEAPNSERLSFDRKLRKSSLKIPQNVQECKEQFISQKYKDNPVNNQVLEPKNSKQAVQYSIPLGQDNQRPTISGTYISGDCVYDKNGQFLYRIL